MSSKKLLVALLSFGLVYANAEDEKKDVVALCGKFYKVLFENDTTRIIQAKQNKGDLCPMSYFPNRFIIMNKSVEIKVTNSDGTSFIWKATEGLNMPLSEATIATEVKSGQLDIVIIQIK